MGKAEWWIYATPSNEEGCVVPGDTAEEAYAEAKSLGMRSEPGDSVYAYKLSDFVHIEDIYHDDPDEDGVEPD